MFTYRAGTPVIGGGISGYQLVQRPSLTPPCGDGIREVGVEACDGGDLADQTCASQGQGSGSLACAANCTFDLSDCSGS